MRRVACVSVSVVALIATVAAGPLAALADDASEAGHGVVHAELEAAAAVCSGLQVDMATQLQRLKGAAIDPDKPSAAFERGYREADARASEAIANERLRSFCNDILRSYGPGGTSISGLVKPR